MIVSGRSLGWLLSVFACATLACSGGARDAELQAAEAEAESEAEAASESEAEAASESESESGSEAEAESESDPALFEGGPEEGCELSAPARVFAGDAWVDVAASGEGFLVAGVSRLGDGEHAFAVAVAVDGTTRLTARRAIEGDAPAGYRRAGPALAVAGGRAAFAFADGRGSLELAFFDAGGEGPLLFTPAAEGASLRFAPVMAWRGPQLLLAWTDQSGGRRRVFVARVEEGRVSDPVDVTPPSGAGSAPAFVDGASSPRLVFFDAREALSVMLRVDASGDALGEAEVARPVSLLTDPPTAAAFAMQGSDWVVYTGIGAAATTAVGLLALSGLQRPAAVVPGTGYGALTLDVARLGAGALIAAEAPVDAAAGSDQTHREVHLRVVDRDGALGAPITLRGPRGTASRVRVAVTGGVVAVAFADRDGAYVALGRCAPP